MKAFTRISVVLITLLMGWSTAHAQLLNDECENAISVGSCTISFSNEMATTDGPDHGASACDARGYSHIENDIWYKYQNSCGGLVTISLCGSDFDTKMAVYSNACPSGSNSLPVVCSDDYPFCSVDDDHGAQVTFDSDPFRTYYIRIGGFEGARGNGTMTISDICPNGSNDDCSCARPVEPGAHAFNTLLATTSGPMESLVCGNQADNGQIYKDLWFELAATCTGEYEVSTCESTFNTVVAIYEAGKGCPYDQNAIACNDNSDCGLQSKVTFNGVEGKTYYIRVGGDLPLSAGAGILRITNPCCTPDFEMEAPFYNYENSTVGAGIDNERSPAADHSIAVEIPCFGDWTFALCGSELDTRMFIGSQCGWTNLASDNDALFCGDDARITLRNIEPGTYYVTVTGESDTSDVGNYSLSVYDPDFEADFTINAEVNDVKTHRWNTVLAGNDCCLRPSNDVSYKINIPCKGRWTFSTCGSITDTWLYLGTGPCKGDISENNDVGLFSLCGPGAEIVAELDSGTYYLTVEGRNRFNVGAYRLNVSGLCKDIEVLSIEQPTSNCELTGNENVLVKVRNNAVEPVVGLELTMRMIGVNGLTVIKQVVEDPIYSEYFVAFDKGLNLAADGVYEIQLSAALEGDEVPENNSITEYIVHSREITEFPYAEDFDEDNTGWNAGGANSSWQTRIPFGLRLLGNPPETPFSRASWITDGNGNHNRNENSWVQSPCLDFTLLTCPEITFDANFDLEEGVDGARLLASVDGGTTWMVVGDYEEGTASSWYNVRGIASNGVETNGGFWSGRSRGWKNMRHSLSDLAGHSNVLLRLSFQTDFFGQNEGFAFDNVVVRETPIDLEASDIYLEAFQCAYTSNEPITVMLKNHSCTDATGFDIRYKINDPGFGQFDWVTENVGSFVVPALGEAAYTFDSLADFSAFGQHDVYVEVMAEGDEVFSNSIEQMDVMSQLPVSVFPYIQTFDLWGQCDEDCGVPCRLPFFSGWYNSSELEDKMDWKVDAGRTPSAATGPAFARGGLGKFLFIESSAECAETRSDVVSPCFSLNRFGECPKLSFYYHMFGAEMGALHLDVSVNGGEWIEDIIDPIVGQQQEGAFEPWLQETVYLYEYIGDIVRFRWRGEAAGELSDMAIDQVSVYYDPFNVRDLELVEIKHPTTDCSLGMENVTVVIENTNCEPIFDNMAFNIHVTGPNGMDVEWYEYPDTFPLLPGKTMEYSFIQPIDFSANGAYEIYVHMIAEGDVNPVNDDKKVSVYNVNYVSEYPYYQNFEAGEAGWIAYGANASWELGIPQAEVINTPPPATPQSLKSWGTNLEGVYNDGENSYVMSPCFDFANVCNPMVSFDIWWESEASSDGFKVQSSIDFGATWQDVGHFVANGEQGWYNGFVKGLAWTGTTEGISGNAAEGLSSDHWTSMEHQLAGLGGYTNVRLRMVFGSDQGGVATDGIAFDNVKVWDVAPTANAFAERTIDVCAGSVVTLGGNPTATGGLEGYSYAWTPNGSFENAGEEAPEVTIDESTVFEVVVADREGCTDTSSVNVSVFNNISPAFLSDRIYCVDGDAVELVAASTGGEWTGNGVTNSSLGTFNPQVAGIGTHEITYTMMDEVNGCEVTRTTIVEVIRPKAANITTDKLVFCTADEGMYFESSEQGGMWNGAGIINETSGYFNPAEAGVGMHTISYGFDVNGCVSYDELNIEVIETPSAEIDLTGNICVEDAPFNLTASVEGGYWSGNGLVHPNEGTFNASSAGVGEHIITYSLANKGCIGMEQVAIIVNANPDATIETEGPFCFEDDAIQLTAVTNGGTWSGFDAISAQGMLNASLAGAGKHTVTYEVAADNGCTGIESLEIEIAEALALNEKIEHVNCFGTESGIVRLDVEGGFAPYTINWSNGMTGESVEGIAAGKYQVMVMSQKGCTLNQTIVITEPTEIVKTTGDVTNASGANALDGAIYATFEGGEAPYSYLWSNGARTANLMNVNPGSYSVGVTDNLGCKKVFYFEVKNASASSINIATLKGEMKLYPNPTSDLLNINIELNGTSDINISILDVTGAEVFEWSGEQLNVVEQQVSLAGFAAGQYMVKIDVDGETISRRVVLTD